MCEKLSHYVIQITLFYFSIYVHSKTFNLWKLQVVRWTVSRHTSYLLRLVERVNVRVCVFLCRGREVFIDLTLHDKCLRVVQLFSDSKNIYTNKLFFSDCLPNILYHTDTTTYHSSVDTRAYHMCMMTRQNSCHFPL